MKTIYFLSLSILFQLSIIAQSTNAVEILEKVDQNSITKSRIVTSEMVIYGQRKERRVVSKGYSEGATKSFSEYLAPAREKGVKMLKLDDRLWIYSPSTDRSIQLSGHMLRQSVMGSDLSYEDLMEDRKLNEIYTAKIVEETTLNDRFVWKLELLAKVDDISYPKQLVWIDKERFVPLKQEFYAKSGQLLKRVTLSDFKQSGNRWYPTKTNYKDVLKNGNGTDFIIQEIKFDVPIPPYILSKAALTN